MLVTDMACFLCMAWFSDPQFCVTQYIRAPPIICCKCNGVDQIVVPQGTGFCKILTEKLHVIPLAGHLGILKLAHTFFQMVLWPKLHETVNYSVYSYTTLVQIKESTAVPRGLLQPFRVPESRFPSWSIEFIIRLPLSYGCNTILACAD